MNGKTTLTATKPPHMRGIKQANRRNKAKLTRTPH